MAIISANEIKLDMLIKNGNKKAALVKKLKSDETKLLSTIQVGITLAGFFSSATAASSISSVLAEAIGIPSEISIVIITLVLSYFTLVFGELFPKRIALRNPEEIAMTFARPIYLIKTIFKPIVFILSVSSDLLVKIFRLKNINSDTVSEEEIVAMIKNGVNSGSINSKEEELINRVFTFDNLTAKDIMTPRVNIFMLDINTPISKFRKIIKEEQYTRVPIYEGDKDNIIGILNLKDIFLFLNSTYTHEDIKSILRKPSFITETINCNNLLKELQETHSQCAIVIDEEGSVSGFITMEDIIEEITGNIYDEHDIVINQITKISDEEYIIDPEISIIDLNKELSLNIQVKTDKYKTLAGYITYFNEVLPKEEDVIMINNLKFIVIQVKRGKILKVKLLIDKQKVA